MQNNYKRLLNFILLVTFLFGYLEWGRDNHTFIFQAQVDLFKKAANDFTSVLHPFTLIPFLGQILIFWSVFQPRPGRRITLTGLACLSSIMVFLFFIGMISPNIRILGSTLPFLVTGFIILRLHRKGRGVS